MDKTSLGDRMKAYENIERKYLTRRLPVIVRVDGKSFHNFTRGFDKPFDSALMSCMQRTAYFLCRNIMGAKLAYTQSDEISLLLTDDDTLDTDAWFGKNLQKIVSVSAAMATNFFNTAVRYKVESGLASDGLAAAYNDEKLAIFDARAFTLPHDEVLNYFVWREQDSTRNSIQMVGYANFSQKELYGKSCNEIQDMLMTQKGINWNDFTTSEKRGTCVIKKNHPVLTPDGELTMRGEWSFDFDIPIFNRSPEYINNLVYHRG